MCLPYGPFYRKQTHLGTKYQGMQQTHVNPEYQIFHQPFPNSSVPNSWHHLKKLVKGWRGSGLKGAASGQETLCLDTVHYWHFDLTWRVADMKVKVFSWMHSGKVAVLIRSVKSITHTHIQSHDIWLNKNMMQAKNTTFQQSWQVANISIIIWS